MPKLISSAKRGVSFLIEHPEWGELAYEMLFRRDSKAHYDLQYAVAQALKLAWDMGRQGKMPPRPAGTEPRRREEPEVDPEIDEIYAEMRMLAWSPLAGTPRPEGHMKWAITRVLQRRAQPAKVAPPARRTRPAQQDPEPVASTRIVKRRRPA